MQTTLSSELTKTLFDEKNSKAIKRALALTKYEDNHLGAITITAINSDFIRCEIRYYGHETQEVEVYKCGTVIATSIYYGVSESVPVQAFRLVAKLYNELNKG